MRKCRIANVCLRDVLIDVLTGAFNQDVLAFMPVLFGLIKKMTVLSSLQGQGYVLEC